MQNSESTILPDHQEKLAQDFEHIYSLINDDNFSEAEAALLNLHYADLADFLDNVSQKVYDVILPAIATKIHPETLVAINDSNKQKAIEALGIQNTAKLMNELAVIDSIEIIESIDQELKEKLLPKLDSEISKQIVEGFKHPENTVGRILEKKFIAFQEHWTCGQAIDCVRRSEVAQDFYAAIIVNNKYKPVGNILLCTLLQYPRNKPIVELMNSDFKVADVHTEQEELAFLFKRYALTIVPVVNKLGRLVGTVSIDNMLYIIEEQAENEFMHLGGINNSDIFDNLLSTAKHRFPWLFVNLITACATSMIINQFSDTIAKLITLATIMPIVASMGGNAGTQAMTVTVRALANREIIYGSFNRVVLKEVLVCAMNGALLALIGGVMSYLVFFDFNLSAVFAAAVTINFTAAGLVGSGAPILLDHFDIDPATASGVFLTAMTDALGFFTFLGLAFFFLV
jgi:magnesium transporter